MNIIRVIRRFFSPVGFVPGDKVQRTEELCRRVDFRSRDFYRNEVGTVELNTYDLVRVNWEKSGIEILHPDNLERIKK